MLNRYKVWIIILHNIPVRESSHTNVKPFCSNNKLLSANFKKLWLQHPSFQISRQRILKPRASSRLSQTCTCFLVFRLHSSFKTNNQNKISAKFSTMGVEALLLETWFKRNWDGSESWIHCLQSWWCQASMQKNHMSCVKEWK